MKAKYANLIEQLERVTAAYNAALSAVLNLEEMVSEQENVLGVYGGINYHGEKFEANRQIHLNPTSFMPAAIDCGYDFEMEDREGYSRFVCTVFGYRVFSLFKGNEKGYEELKAKLIKVGDL